MSNIFKMADEDEERQRFSPDSSTQVLNKEKHKHKKKKKHKHKSKKKKRKHSEDHDDEHSDSTNNSSGASDNDERPDAKQKNDKEFVIDIKPLTEYIDDRKELNNELFKILERKDMKKLMPKSVKKLDVDELKSRCLDQLEVISKKRLLRIIEGQEMNSSSSESGHGTANDVSAMETVQENSVVEASQPVPVTREDESVNIMEELSVGPDQDEIDALIEGTAKNTVPKDVISGQDSPGKAMDIPDDKNAADTESQLLELEFRARALKSLMQARQKHDT